MASSGHSVATYTVHVQCCQRNVATLMRGKPARRAESLSVYTSGQAMFVFVLEVLHVRDSSLIKRKTECLIIPEVPRECMPNPEPVKCPSSYGKQILTFSFCLSVRLCQLYLSRETSTGAPWLCRQYPCQESRRHCQTRRS